MPNIMLSIPKGLYEKLMKHLEIRGGVIIRECIREFLDKLENIEEEIDDILKRLEGLKGELEEISDEEAIAFAIGMMRKRGKMHL
ncbi:MAG: hypothetical protein ACP6IP_03160 [Candidatus Njordarchaeia archaeon]